jgi:hypothetical protein
LAFSDASSGLGPEERKKELRTLEKSVGKERETCRRESNDAIQICLEHFVGVDAIRSFSQKLTKDNERQRKKGSEILNWAFACRATSESRAWSEGTIKGETVEKDAQ